MVATIRRQAIARTAVFLIMCANSNANPIETLNEIKTNYIVESIEEAKGSKLKAVQFKYEDRYIFFQYQFWKVKSESICSDIPKDSELLEFSKCSQAAKRMFVWLCRDYGNDTDDKRKLRGKSMYCEAAASYKPTIVEIEKAKPMNEEQQKRQDCNISVMNGKSLVGCP